MALFKRFPFLFIAVLFLLSVSQTKEIKSFSEGHKNSVYSDSNEFLSSNEILEGSASHGKTHTSVVWEGGKYHFGWLEEEPSQEDGEISASPKTYHGCKKANMCCQGKDNNCLTKGRRMNNRNNETCYCDSSCLALEDCCTDYIEHCPAVDCMTANWGEWSDCDARCGFGVRKRSRTIVQDARNGGKSCEATVQKQVCEGVHCKLTRMSGIGGELRETARILPSEFSQWRNNKLYDPYKDIRRNIFLQNSIPPSRPTYCAVYRLKFVHRMCHSSINSEPLKKDNLVCVECQTMAMQEALGGRCSGHGIHGKETKWNLFNQIGCRGTWIMETERKECFCNSTHSLDPSYTFI